MPDANGRRNLVGANWKMNGSLEANAGWLKEFAQKPPTCETVVFPPFVYLPQVVAGLVGDVAAGGQNLSQHAPGAYTGYGVKTMPGIREAVEARRTAEAQDQAARVAQAIDRYAAAIRVAAEALDHALQ